MKVTKEQAAENRVALLRAASRLFRAHGLDGVGVADICKAAGLTHGALYAQFKSKEALAAEALTYGMRRTVKAMIASSNKAKPAVQDYLDFCISRERRDDAAGGCPMVASASEIARHGRNISGSFTDGFEDTVAAIEAALPQTGSKEDVRDRALAIVASTIGGVAVARATMKSNPQLSDRILKSVRRALEVIAEH